MPETRKERRVTYYVTATGVPDGNDPNFTESQPVFIGEDVGMHHRYPGMWVKHSPTMFPSLEEARSFLGRGGAGYGFRVVSDSIKIVKRTSTVTTTDTDIVLYGEGP